MASLHSRCRIAALVSEGRPARLVRRGSAYIGVVVAGCADQSVFDAPAVSSGRAGVSVNGWTNVGARLVSAEPATIGVPGAVLGPKESVRAPQPNSNPVVPRSTKHAICRIVHLLHSG